MRQNRHNQQKDNLKQRLLDLLDLQELFKVTRGTIYNWRRQGIFKVIKIGGRQYIDARDIEELLETYKQTQVPGEKSRRQKTL